MAIKVGTLQVDLIANTASFTGPLDKAGQQAKKSARDIQDGLNGMDFSEARGGLMLIDDLLGVQIPRHALSFASQIPGLMQIASFAMPAAAIAAIGMGIVSATEKLQKHNEEMEKSKQEALETAVAYAKHGDALQISNMRLQDQLSILGRQLPQNGIKIAMLEGKSAVEQLVAEFQKAIDKESELMGKQTQGIWDRLMNGDSGQNDIIAKAKEFKTQIDDLTQQMQTAAALGRTKDASDYKNSLDTKVASFKDYLSNQQSTLDNRKKLAVDSLTAGGGQSMGVNGEMMTQEAEDQATAIKDVNEQYAGTQRVLNDLTILSHSYGQQQQEQATNNALTTRLSLDKEVAQYNDAQLKKMVLLKKSLDEAQAMTQKTTDENIKEAEKENAAKIKGIDEYLEFLKNSAKTEQAIAVIQTEISAQDTVQAQRMAIATGQMTQQKAVQETLATLEANKTSELTKINGELANQLALVKQLGQATNGGTTGTNDQNLQYEEAVELYQQMKTKELEIEKKFQQQINQLRLQAANNEQSQWNKMFLDFSQLQTHMSQVARQSLGQMNSDVASFVVTGSGNFRQFASSAIESFVKMALEYAESKAESALLDTSFFAAKKALNFSDANSSAATAAAATLADVPYPLNIAASASVLALGEGFAADAMAERGALLPNRQMMVNTHPEEMILPRPISNFIVNAAANASGGGGSNHHFVFAPTVHAVDSDGVDKMLTQHADTFHRHIMGHLRRMNFN